MTLFILVVACFACYFVGYAHKNVVRFLVKKWREAERKRRIKARKRLFVELKKARKEAFREV